MNIIHPPTPLRSGDEPEIKRKKGSWKQWQSPVIKRTETKELRKKVKQMLHNKLTIADVINKYK